MRIRGYLPRGIVLTWLLGIPLEVCDNETGKDKVRDIINRFINHELGNVPIKYEVRELSHSYLVRFTAEVSEPAATCRKHSDYEFKDCVYTCISSNIPLHECEEACRVEVESECHEYGQTVSELNLSSIAHDFASLLEACNVKYYALFGASTELYIVSFIALFT
jgi:thioester reductase-like protein